MNLATTFIIGSLGLKKINDIINPSLIKSNIDELIEKKIEENKKSKKKYQLGKFKSTRKIPNKNELKIIYDKFINKNKINKNVILNPNHIFLYEKKYTKLNLHEPFLMFQLNLKSNKNYKIHLSFEISHCPHITFLFHNSNNILFPYNNEKKNNKIKFITNIISRKFYTKYTQSQFYILFDKYKKNTEIFNIFLKIDELDTKIIYPMTIIKTSEKNVIF